MSTPDTKTAAESHDQHIRDARQRNADRASASLSVMYETLLGYKYMGLSYETLQGKAELLYTDNLFRWVWVGVIGFLCVWLGAFYFLILKGHLSTKWVWLSAILWVVTCVVGSLECIRTYRKIRVTRRERYELLKETARRDREDETEAHAINGARRTT